MVATILNCVLAATTEPAPMTDEHLEIAFMGLGIVALAELVLVVIWLPGYFRTGIVLFRKEFPCPASPAEPRPTVWEANFESTLVKQLLFREIGEGEYAFREKLIQFSLFGYLPLMYGHIMIDAPAECVVVTGRPYWCLLGLVVVLGILSVMFPNLVVLLVLTVVILGIIYAVQAHRFTRVGRFVSSTLCEVPLGRINLPQ